MAASSAILAIKIIADATDATKEFEGFAGAVGDFEEGIKGLAGPSLALAAALGTIALAAANDEAEQRKLLRVYQNATGTTDDYTAAINAAIKAGQAKAFSDSDVRAALIPLITATGNAAEAQALLGPAMDIARVAGVSLETAASALAKAHEGQAASLARLLPGLDKGANATETIANATLLAAGAAADYATTGVGQIALVTESFMELAEAVGVVFLPVITATTGVLQQVAGFLTQQLDIIQPLAIAFGAAAVAILAVNAALAVLALLSSPITLFVVAIAAIAAGLVMLYQRSEAFRTIVTTVFTIGAELVGTMVDAINILGGVAQRVFDGFGLVVGSVFAVVKGIFDGVLAWAQAPFVSWQEIVTTVFGAVQTVISTVVGAITLIFAGILAMLRQPFEDFQTIATGVFDVVKGAVQTAFDVMKGIWDGLLAVLRAPFEAFDDIVKTVMDTVTALVQTAMGVIQGILDGIGNAIGALEDAVDAVNPFAILPPAGGGGGAPATSLALMGRRTARSAGMGGGGGPNVNINVQSADPSEVMRAIRRWSRNNGGSGPFNRGLDRSTA